MPDAPLLAGLDQSSLEQYLGELYGAPAKLTDAALLGESDDEAKEYGYGRPVALTCEVDGDTKRAVLHTMKASPFGHEHMADRAAIWLWSHGAFNELPRHVPSLDVGAFRAGGRLISLGDAEEFFLLTGFVEGNVYAKDLERLRRGGSLTKRDLDRADALCDYLIRIHKKEGPDPSLYVRKARQLIGHGECIMGLVDSYPLAGGDHPWITPDLLEAIEHAAVQWRWRLKRYTHRLRQVHGDFHPWNILFADDDEEGETFHVLDRSRGAWGEPADDVTSLTMNYLFESLLSRGRFEGAFRELYERFWQRYLTKTHDEEMLEVAAPFIAFRGLVMASPVWYPHIDDAVRRALFDLMKAVLADEAFDPLGMDEYLAG